MNIFYKLKLCAKYYSACRMADKAHKKDHDQYYVIPTGKDGLVVTDRKNFKKLRSKGYVSKSIGMNRLQIESFYQTAKADGTGVLSPAAEKTRKKNYYKYCEAQSLIQRQQKAMRKRMKEEDKKGKEDEKC